MRFTSGRHQLKRVFGHHLRPPSLAKYQTQVFITFYFEFERNVRAYYAIKQNKNKVIVEVTVQSSAMSYLYYMNNLCKRTLGSHLFKQAVRTLVPIVQTLVGIIKTHIICNMNNLLHFISSLSFRSAKLYYNHNVKYNFNHVYVSSRISLSYKSIFNSKFYLRFLSFGNRARHHHVKYRIRP